MTKTKLITYINIHCKQLETIQDVVEDFQNFLDNINSVAYHRRNLIHELTDEDLIEAGFNISRSYEISPTGKDEVFVRVIDSLT